MIRPIPIPLLLASRAFPTLQLILFTKVADQHAMGSTRTSTGQTTHAISVRMEHSSTPRPTSALHAPLIAPLVKKTPPQKGLSA